MDKANFLFSPPGALNGQSIYMLAEQRRIPLMNCADFLYVHNYMIFLKLNTMYIYSNIIIQNISCTSKLDVRYNSVAACA